MAIFYSPAPRRRAHRDNIEYAAQLLEVPAPTWPPSLVDQLAHEPTPADVASALTVEIASLDELAGTWIEDAVAKLQRATAMDTIRNIARHAEIGRLRTRWMIDVNTAAEAFARPVGRVMSQLVKNAKALPSDPSDFNSVIEADAGPALKEARQAMARLAAAADIYRPVETNTAGAFTVRVHTGWQYVVAALVHLPDVNVEERDPLTELTVINPDQRRDMVRDLMAACSEDLDRALMDVARGAWPEAELKWAESVDAHRARLQNLERSTKYNISSQAPRQHPAASVSTGRVVLARATPW